MITWIFDVDGVLCDAGTTIDPVFKEWFIKWAKGKRIVLVTGSTKDRMITQVGEEIFNLAEISFNCLGNSIWMHGKETRINQIVLHKDEHRWLLDAVENSKFYIKTGNHIEFRPGSINLSILGRNANIRFRKEYKTWDANYKERESLIKEFVEKFPRFEAFIGGDTSIDICLRGANKGQCADMIPNRDKFYFFGDRCFEGGIDKPFADRCSAVLGDKVFKVNGYQDTWNILKEEQQ